MTEIEQIVSEYYGKIDACAFDWIINLFTNDAIYERADSTFSGLAEIDDFFRNKRKIHGTHTVETIALKDNQVFAVGHFVGKGATDNDKSVGFVDVWDFNDNNKVTKRRSYLAVGHEVVLK